jgi:nucleotide-binding universal stress UspA family protein
MAAYRRILVATDFSAAADLALDEAIRIAAEMRATLAILHVYQLPLSEWQRPGVVRRDHRHRSYAERKVSRRLLRAWRTHITATPILEQGAPDLKIVEVAEREGADLIVMGTRGPTQRLILGSVAARVVANAPCAVLTICTRLAAARREESELKPTRRREVVAALGGSEAWS